MAYLGSWKIDDYLPIPVTCHRFSSGAAYAPTSLTYSIYEDATTTGLYEDVDMTPASPFDGVVGFYLARVQLTAAAGFEKGKNYTVLIKATVDSVAAIATHTFQIEAEVDSNSVSGTVGTVTNLTNLPAITTDWLTAAGVKADAVTKIQAGLATPTNITAGTITTTTNLTNLPAITNDWLTAAGIKADAVTKIQAGLLTEGNGGTLTLTYTVNITGGGVLEGATVKLYSDSNRTTLVNTKITNVLGQVTFTNLVAGIYYLTTTMSGYEDMTDSEVVA